MTCNGGTQECCITLGGRGGAAGPTCAAIGQCAGGLPVGCASDANCPAGQTCCLSLAGAGASCSATCVGRGGGGAAAQLCATNAECPAGDTCQAALFGLRVCLPAGLGGFGGAGGGGGGGAGGGGGGGGGRCASPDTPIATPEGDRPIAEIQAGDVVYSVDHDAIRPVVVLRVGSVRVSHHRVVRVEFEDGRKLEISAPHPTADGRRFGDLRAGGTLDGHRIRSVERIPYEHESTYDLLPASDTGTYFAAGVRIGSTLAPGETGDTN
jgi:hypothetical protein